MAKKISVEARHELVQAIGARYRASPRQEKLRILDEFVAVTGYHRKHSIRILNVAAVRHSSEATAPRARRYDAAVREAVVVLWEASDRVCGKRLKPSCRCSSSRLSATVTSDSTRLSGQIAVRERSDHRSIARGTSGGSAGTAGAAEDAGACRSAKYPGAHVR